MNFIELLDTATEAAGSQRQLAKQIGIDAPKISEWRKGKYKPTAEHIAMLAEIAGKPVFQTLAEVQKDLNPAASEVWSRALGKLKAAGVAAAWILVLQLASRPENANAANNLAHQKQAHENIHRSKYDGCQRGPAQGSLRLCPVQASSKVSPCSAPACPTEIACSAPDPAFWPEPIA